MAHKMMPVALHKNHWKGGKKKPMDPKSQENKNKKSLRKFVSGRR